MNQDFLCLYGIPFQLLEASYIMPAFAIIKEVEAAS